jgi:hypothetical protein
MKRKLIAIAQASLVVLGLAAVSGCGGDPYAYDRTGYGYAGSPYAYSTVPPVYSYEPRVYRYHYDERAYRQPETYQWREREAEAHRAKPVDHDRAVNHDRDDRR